MTQVVGVRLRRGFLLIVAALVLLAPDAAYAASDPGMRREPLTIVTSMGRFRFEAEIADTPETRTRGLMFRRSMGENEGMLFDFKFDQPISMWMRNTYIPLDMIFILADGRVNAIAENTKPLSRDIIPSQGPVRYVLEVVAGTAKRIGLRPGDRIEHSLFRNVQ